MSDAYEDNRNTGLEIAIVGMSGRFPGANNLEQFWENIRQGIESISTFSDDELLAAGVDPGLLQRENYVKSKGYIEGIEDFDAGFFAYSPREAEITDPQIRIMQETTWEALEQAGYDPASYKGSIGLYVGAATNFHWMEMSPLLRSTSAAEFSEAGTLCYKDALSTYTSYKLGLNGPSFTLYTACSTSLLAVHLASRALLMGECTMAVAGGVRVSYPTKSGYLYEQGMTASPDGKVRAFDAQAQGAVFSDGVGVVVLKRLEDAIEDGDTIHAVIKGTAANNDGNRKIGYTAPSIDGQAEVIQAAHSFAEVSPESISYIETHGTATPLGDTMEIEALKRAFANTEERGFCAIGSVKSNVGHLDTAAGVTGLIKTVLALKHKEIPPTLHVQQPNPKISFVDSPFYLSRELQPWETEGSSLRRAGVSAFGYGGTNVHVIVEETAPALLQSAGRQETEGRQLLVLSARSENALRQAAVQLADALEKQSAAEWPHTAYTTQVGRRAFGVRCALAVEHAADAIRRLRGDIRSIRVEQIERRPYLLLPNRANEAIHIAVNLADQDANFRSMLEDALLKATAYAGHNLSEAMDTDRLSAADAPLVLTAIGFALACRMKSGLPMLETVGVGLSGHAAAAANGSVSLEEAFRRAATDGDRTLIGDEAEVRGLEALLDRQDAIVLAMRPVEPVAGGATVVAWESDILAAFGRFWERGIDVAWTALHTGKQRRRIPLPTYPFEKQRYWLEAEGQGTELGGQVLLEKNPDVAQWFYEPEWTLAEQASPGFLTDGTWLLFADAEGVAERLAARLKAQGNHIVLIWAADSFAEREDGNYGINPRSGEDYEVLLRSLRGQGRLPERMVHLWNVSRSEQDAAIMDSGFYSLIYLAKAISRQNMIHPLEISIITNAMQLVNGEENEISPAKQTALAPVKVLPQEYPNIRSRSLDIELNDVAQSVELLAAELMLPVSDTVIAYRDGQRYIQTFRSLPREALQRALLLNPHEAAPGLKPRGVYLITGGLGGIGLKLAEYLARSVQASLVLIGRTGLPDRSQWEAHLANCPAEDTLALRIRAVQRLEALGSRVLVLAADVADLEQMQSAKRESEHLFGPIQGIIHAAGVLRVRSAQCVMASISREECEEQLRPKLQGVRVLEELFLDRELDFCLLVSSLSPLLGGLGFVAYAGANLYLDGVADRLSRKTGCRWMSINWGDWQYTGAAYDKSRLGEALEPLEMTPEEGIKTFQCLLDIQARARVIVSSGDLHARYGQWISLESRQADDGPAHQVKAIGKKPQHALASSLDQNVKETEQIIADIWRTFYRTSQVNVADNFFDLGATSLDMIQIHAKLVHRFERHIPIDVMFEFPSIRALAMHLSGKTLAPSQDERETPLKSIAATGDIAIIGMAGRFPGASNINEYWSNLVNDIESIARFSAEELLEAGVPESDVYNPHYVPAKGYLAGNDRFDSAFFDYTPRDAALMDPQLRVYHEVAWHALEHAGYVGESFPGLIGVYGGASPNLYWQVLSTLSESSEPAGQFLISLLNDKDSLTTQISYKFNLKGPSVNVFTGCSTSLVAIHTASQALLNGHCDMALAGGITLTLPDKAGYVHQEGMLFSVDGHCKAFDEGANGMLFGDGVGIVVLKRLEEALADGDTVHAVIKGTAINNDGNRKIGYTAPSIDGQAEVIKQAQRAAGVGPMDISYIETHGTGTKLGDTIEIKALRQAFPAEAKQVVPIGSVKSNIGHLNAASGVAGLIKTVLSMQHKQIPASLNNNEPNRSIDFENSPFFVNTRLRDWNPVQEKRRAGVSSFGIGGTNAHVVLEEAPPKTVSTPSRPYQLLVLSAKTDSSLDRMTESLAAHLTAHPELSLADAAYTLAVGRKAFKHRRAWVAESVSEAAELMSASDGRRMHSGVVKEGSPKVAFLFAGNGSQYINMGRDLYDSEPLFRQHMDQSFDILNGLLGQTLRDVVYPPVGADLEACKRELAKMECCQPIILAFEYALAALLQGWGVEPDVLMGYSFGEYAAACLAGVFSLEDALKLIVVRGRLMSSLSSGAMLSVPLDENVLMPLMDDYMCQSGERLSLSVVNGSSCIVAGSDEAIGGFETVLRSRRLLCMRVTIEGAAHSHRLDPILDAFAREVKGIELNPPITPYISCITGMRVTREQATDPLYWVRHMRETVRFAEGIQHLRNENAYIFVEIGPGRDLSVMVQRYLDASEAAVSVVNTIRPQAAAANDTQYLLNQLARLWTLGVAVDWDGYYGGEQRGRVPLSGYSFEPTSYKPQGNPFDLSMRPTTVPISAGKKTNRDEWFYTTQWTSKPWLPVVHVAEQASRERWLVFADETGFAVKIASSLRMLGGQVTIAYLEDHCPKTDMPEDAFILAAPDDYRTLLQVTGLPTKVIYGFGVTSLERQPTSEFASQLQKQTFYPLFDFARALSSLSVPHRMDVLLVANGVQSVTGDERLVPEKATMLAAALVLPQEYSYLTCSSVDLILPHPGSKQEGRAINGLIAEALNPKAEKAIAYRGLTRFIQHYEPVLLPRPQDEAIPLKDKGVYLITGGLGGIGLLLAEHLAHTTKGNIVLVSRTGLPPRSEWINHLETDSATAAKIRRIQACEALGAVIDVQAVDVADRVGMAELIRNIEATYGPLNGVVHAAGIIGGSTFNLIKELRQADCEAHFVPKLYGTLVLEDVLADKKLDFVLLMSSISAVLGGLGYWGYAASNLYLDRYAAYHNQHAELPWLSVNWSDWKYGPAEDAPTQIGASIHEQSMLPEEGIDAFNRVLCYKQGELLVHSPGDLNTRINQWVKLQGLQADQEETAEESAPLHARPALINDYLAPRNEVEQRLARIWQRVFRIGEIGVLDDFMELGGDSLKAITVVSRIHQEFRVEVPVAELFAHSTIDRLVSYIQAAAESGFETIEPAPDKPYYALSSAQKRFYILHRLYPESTAYNDTSVLLLEGRLDVPQLESSFLALLDRHEIFRTTLEMVNNELLQKVYPQAALQVEHFDADESDVQRIVAEFVRPFDLNDPPYMRIGLIRLTPDQHVLIIDLHHLVTDGVSYDIFVRDFLAFYAGCVPQPLRLQYKDYAEWQNSAVQREASDRQKAYWLKQFRGELPVLNMPIDYPRPAMRNLTGKSFNTTIDAKLSAAVRSFASREGNTLYTVLFAVYSVLLAKYSGQNDIVIGSPITGRPHADLQQIIGVFVNMLPIRVQPQDDKTFRGYLHEVRQQTLESFENQSYQYDDLVQALGLQGSVNRNPLFDVALVMQNIDTDVLEVDGLTVSSYDYDHQRAQFDLLLRVFEGGETLSFTWEYAATLYKRESIEKLWERYISVLEQVIVFAEVRLEDIQVKHELVELAAAANPEDFRDFDF